MHYVRNTDVKKKKIGSKISVEIMHRVINVNVLFDYILPATALNNAKYLIVTFVTQGGDKKYTQKYTITFSNYNKSNISSSEKKDTD